MSDKLVSVVISIVSVLVPGLVAVLLFMPQFFKMGDNDFSFLPHFNAVINSSTAVSLLFALFFIKRGQISAHKISMTSGMILSIVFLLSYVVYHSQSISTHFGGEGIIKTIYFILLITHILLSAIVVPLVLFAFYYGLKDDVIKHKKIVKFAYPIWLYVAVSGVIVYLMISPYYE